VRAIPQANNIRVALPVTHNADEFNELDSECDHRAVTATIACVAPSPPLLLPPHAAAAAFTKSAEPHVRRRLTIGLWLAVACLAIEMIGLFGGYTIFRTGVTLQCASETSRAWRAPLLNRFSAASGRMPSHLNSRSGHTLTIAVRPLYVVAL
jgi:hypothetical protein